MKTKLLYLEDPYLREMDAEIVEVIPDEGGLYRVILDRTVFYPFGGGQPTDQGWLEPSFEVNKVWLKDGDTIVRYKVE